MIPFYNDKFLYLYHRQGGNCAIAASKNDYADPTDLHHAKIHNTKQNRRKYPVFINSVFNLMAVNNHYHLKNPSFGAVRGDITPARYESFLNNPIHWKCRMFAEKLEWPND